MKIAIPLDGRVRTVLHTSFLIARRETDKTYSVTGDALQMSGVSPEQLLILPDSVEIASGQTVTADMEAQAQALETFTTMNAEEALSEALGLLLRTAVADGKVTDAE
ncbi:hypothetical protein [Butyricicoccus sp.]|uniref:hypothetical protein n=1 Tax=Butyricicoccus sp. TaxID=2049021 RepID=UPI003AAF9168